MRESAHIVAIVRGPSWTEGACRWRSRAYFRGPADATSRHRVMVPVHAPFFMYAWVRETRRLTLIWACDGVLAHAQLHPAPGYPRPVPPMRCSLPPPCSLHPLCTASCPPAWPAAPDGAASRLLHWATLLLPPTSDPSHLSLLQYTPLLPSSLWPAFPPLHPPLLLPLTSQASGHRPSRT